MLPKEAYIGKLAQKVPELFLFWQLSVTIISGVKGAKEKPLRPPLFESDGANKKGLRKKKKIECGILYMV